MHLEDELKIFVNLRNSGTLLEMPKEIIGEKTKNISSINNLERMLEDAIHEVPIKTFKNSRYFISCYSI